MSDVDCRLSHCLPSTSGLKQRSLGKLKLGALRPAPVHQLYIYVYSAAVFLCKAGNNDIDHKPHQPTKHCTERETRAGKAQFNYTDPVITLYAACQVLPYHTGKMFYRLALRPLTGPMRIPELTVRLQNPQVQYSPGSIPIPETIPLPRGGLLT